MKHPIASVTLAFYKKTAKEYAERHKSDPFCYGRTLLYLCNGYLVCDELVNDREETK